MNSILFETVKRALLQQFTGVQISTSQTVCAKFLFGFDITILFLCSRERSHPFWLIIDESLNQRQDENLRLESDIVILIYEVLFFGFSSCDSEHHPQQKRNQRTFRYLQLQPWLYHSIVSTNESSESLSCHSWK